MKIEFKENLTEEEANSVIDVLEKHCQKNEVDSNYYKVNLLLKDEDGKICGGLLGHTVFNHLNITEFAVDESLRGQGYGTKLLREAEDFGRKHGCAHVHVATTEFQAPKFYEKCGYKLMFIREDKNPKFNKYFFHKKL